MGRPWRLQARLGLYGDTIAPRSILKYVLKQGTNVVARVACETRYRGQAEVFDGNLPVPDIFTTRRSAVVGDAYSEWTS